MAVVPYLRHLNLRVCFRYSAAASNKRSSQKSSSEAIAICYLPSRHHASDAANLTRTAVELESSVEQELTDKLYRPKAHPGSVKIKSVALPDRFREAAAVVLREKPVQTLVTQSEVLIRYLWSRKSPPENSHYKESVKQLEEEFTRNELREKKIETLSTDLKAKISQKVLYKLRSTTYHWQPVEYDDNKSLLYLVGRASSDNAALVKIFSEIRQRVPEFKPTALLDFGSGVGTAFWATRHVWNNSLKEYFGVDSSPSMNELARLLVQDGQPNNMPIVKNTFFRQFLPASHTLGYSIVVSAFSLLELPNATLRLQTLDKLWTKTDEFLVIVEQGTNAGYKMVVEARDFILKTSKVDAYVFSPCNHDLACPRLSLDNTPCNFEIGYFPLVSKSRAERKLIGRYSYVVLRKGRRSESDSWPRIIREVLPRSRHVICRMCCNDGQLKEAVFTAKKSGKLLYKCARASYWGDRLPVVDIESQTDCSESKKDCDDNHSNENPSEQLNHIP